MTKARWTILGAVLVALLGVAFFYRQSLVLRIASMRPFVEDRFDGWVEAGADEAELDAAFRRVHDPIGSGAGSWVYEVSLPAAEHEARARELEAAGEVEAASEEWRQAAVFYYIARFPFLGNQAKAAVNIGGPIHLSFSLEHAETVHESMVKTIAHAMGEDLDQSIAEMIEKIEPFSLERQGLLRVPERQAPLLSINGDQDPLVTIDDLYIISESGIAQEEWVYAGDGHCASGNASEHVPKAAAWIKAQLGGVGG